MKTLWSVGPAKTGLTVSTLTAVLILLAGCGQQVDLYDYFGDDTTAGQPSANAAQPGQTTGGAQPANALAGNSSLGATDAALANARPSNGLQKISLKTHKVLQPLLTIFLLPILTSTSGSTWRTRLVHALILILRRANVYLER